MALVTCPDCSTPNPPTYSKCRKCNAPLDRAAGAPANPYAPPAESGGFVPREGEDGDGVWRDGPHMVVARGADLPARCVRCNRPSEGRGVKRKLYWHPPGWYLLILVSLLIYVIVAMVVRKSVTVFVGLCPEHRDQRRKAIIGVLVLVFAGFGVIFAGISSDSDLTGVLVLAGVVVLLAAVLWAILATRTLSPKRIDDDYARLGGASDAFLSSLPVWGGSMGLLRR